MGVRLPIFHLEVHRDFDEDKLHYFIESEVAPDKEKVLQFLKDDDIEFDEKYHKFYISEVNPLKW